MEKEKEREVEPSKYFECNECQTKYKYDDMSKFKGKKANLHLLEGVYYMKDPFEPVHDIPLILGGVCSVCSSTVCVSQKCSVFYTKRFCKQCFKRDVDHFPEEVKKQFGPG